MKSIQKTLGIVVILAISLCTQAQSVDQVISKWVDASGGKEKLQAIQSIYSESTMTIMGNQAPALSYVQDGKGSRSEVDFNGQKVITTVTDKNGWSINPLQGQPTAQPMPEDQRIASKPDLSGVGPLFNYQAKGYQAVLNGKDTLEGTPVYLIKLNAVNGKEPQIDVYVDAAKYFILKVVRHITINGQGYDIVINYSQFKPTDYGYTMAFTQDLDIAGLKISTELKKVQINKTIDPALFEMPK
jgi:outer membrane lipoprotein-sorting protein